MVYLVSYPNFWSYADIDRRITSSVNMMIIDYSIGNCLMTDTSADDSEDEQSWARLRDETTRADVYCHEDHKQEWQEEAEHNGQSLSRYLYDLIEEARGYREGGLPLLESKDERSVSRNLNPGSKSYRMNSIKLFILHSDCSLV